MVVYDISKSFLLAYAQPDRPFLSFDQFNNLVRLYRDEFYATQYVEGFIYDIGVRYNVWTVDTVNRYHRHLFFDRIRGRTSISFEIPHARANATIPLEIAIFDEGGLYFTQRQRVTIEHLVGGKPVLCGWRKIDTVRDFVLRETGAANVSE
ncbi:MAG: hypothetical protein KDK28_00045 [Maritimibacter sp.]|nr:hypothetical protein [Maritimibacter sp.]